MLISPLGDSAAVVALGERVEAETFARVRAIAYQLQQDPPTGVCDVVAAFASVAVFFDRPRESFAHVRREIEARVSRAANSALPRSSSRHVSIPVCYSPEFGPDLEAVARHTGLSTEQVVAAHTAAEYFVCAIGFLPGFPYLAVLPPQLATPRRTTPRAHVPAGAVGIGGAQTGVYPIASPGGWNLIGQTPLNLFDASRAEAALLRTGDRVTFAAIPPEEFKRFGRPAPTTVENAPPDSSSFTPDPNEPGARSTGLAVIKPGMLTTVQDLGRQGHRSAGVPLSGAVDPFALRLANLLVGNPENAAGLEFTLLGPELEFRRDALVALGGADFGLPLWRPFQVRKGQTLRLGPARSGCRGYIAIAGGIDTPPVLGSRSTYARAQLGGWCGRALREGDVLPLAEVNRRVVGRWRIDPALIPAYTPDPVVRVSSGAQTQEFTGELHTHEFKVSPQSDRMGMRLKGSRIDRRRGRDMLSTPVAPGTIQVPPDGQPIVLLADAQTIGGYPQFAHVASVDLPLIAQLRPGDTVRFRTVSIEEIYDVLNERERALGMLRQGLAEKLA